MQTTRRFDHSYGGAVHSVANSKGKLKGRWFQRERKGVNQHENVAFGFMLRHSRGDAWRGTAFRGTGTNPDDRRRGRSDLEPVGRGEKVPGNRKSKRCSLDGSVEDNGAGQDVGLRTPSTATETRRRYRSGRSWSNLEPRGCQHEMHRGSEGEGRRVERPVANHSAGQDVGLRTAPSTCEGLTALSA